MRLPLFIESAGEDLKSLIFESRSNLEEKLLAHGALLFRGFSINDAELFEQVANAWSDSLIAYVGGNSPRTPVLGRIYTSTDYPADLEIVLHNEMAFADTWPRTLLFQCTTPPTTGGETPLLDGRRFLEVLDAPLVDLFSRKRVKYVRTLRSRSQRGVGKCWEDSFGTEDKKSVEAALSLLGTHFSWLADGALFTSSIRPAIARHPSAGHETWFNQILLFHRSSLPEAIRRLQERRHGSQHAHMDCVFEDDTPIEDSIVDRIRSLSRAEEVVFQWERGDVVVIDNLLAAHGRRAFVGPRRILAAMAQ